MTLVFWFAAGLLVTGALLFVLPPLLRPPVRMEAGESPLAAYREQRARLDAELSQGEVSAAAHARGIAELQGRVADEVGELGGAAALPAPAHRAATVAAALSVALLLPAGALGLYALLGKPAALQSHAFEGTVMVALGSVSFGASGVRLATDGVSP